MIIRHARAPYSSFVLLFHMAIFFIASGYLYNHNNTDNIASLILYIRKKIRSLYLPYIAYMVIYLLLHNMFISLNIYTDNMAIQSSSMIEDAYASIEEYHTISQTIRLVLKSTLFQASTQLGGAFWFLQVLLVVMIGYAIIEYCIKLVVADKKKVVLVQGAIAVIALLLGWCCHVYGWWAKGLNRCCSVYALICLGMFLKDYSVMQKLYEHCKTWIVMTGSLFILLGGYNKGYISIASNDVENPLFFLLMSAAGWCLLYSLANCLVNIKWKVYKIFCYISVHSMPIIALHFLCFKIINVFVVQIYGLEKYLIAAFPVLAHTGCWWVAYTAVGIIVPLFMELIVHKIVNFLKKKYTCFLVK